MFAFVTDKSVVHTRLCELKGRVGRQINDERNPKTGLDPGTGNEGFKPLSVLFSGTLFKTKRIADEIAGGQLVRTEANRHGEYPNNNDRSRALLAQPESCISAVPTVRRAQMPGPGRGTKEKN